MEEPPIDHEEIRRSAVRGARHVTLRRQFVEDAADSAVQKWENKVRSGEPVADVRAWVFAVAKNEARRLAARRGVAGAVTNSEGVLEAASSWVDASADSMLPAVDRADLEAVVRASKKKLVGRQWEVAMKLIEPGMSFHRAAKELGMDRKSVRRSFRSGLKRLDAGQGCPPLLLGLMPEVTAIHMNRIGERRKACF